MFLKGTKTKNVQIQILIYGATFFSLNICQELSEFSLTYLLKIIELSYMYIVVDIPPFVSNSGQLCERVL